MSINQHFSYYKTSNLKISLCASGHCDGLFHYFLTFYGANPMNLLIKKITGKLINSENNLVLKSAIFTFKSRFYSF